MSSYDTPYICICGSESELYVVDDDDYGVDGLRCASCITKLRKLSCGACKTTTGPLYHVPCGKCPFSRESFCGSCIRVCAGCTFSKCPLHVKMCSTCSECRFCCRHCDLGCNPHENGSVSIVDCSECVSRGVEVCFTCTIKMPDKPLCGNCSVYCTGCRTYRKMDRAHKAAMHNHNNDIPPNGAGVYMEVDRCYVCIKEHKAIVTDALLVTDLSSIVGQYLQPLLHSIRVRREIIAKRKRERTKQKDTDTAKRQKIEE